MVTFDGYLVWPGHQNINVCSLNTDFSLRKKKPMPVSLISKRNRPPSVEVRALTSTLALSWKSCMFERCVVGKFSGLDGPFWSASPAYVSCFSGNSPTWGRFFQVWVTPGQCRPSDSFLQVLERHEAWSEWSEDTLMAAFWCTFMRTLKKLAYFFFFLLNFFLLKLAAFCPCCLKLKCYI